jgi:hypothetical protein
LYRGDLVSINRHIVRSLDCKANLPALDPCHDDRDVSIDDGALVFCP